METNDRETLREIRDRTARTESRLVQLGDYVGANLRSKQRINIEMNVSGIVYVDIDALDVSISRIVTELQQRNLYLGGQSAVTIYCKGVRVCDLFPGEILK